jgi:hypothetical protein
MVFCCEEMSRPVVRGLGYSLSPHFAPSNEFAVLELVRSMDLAEWLEAHRADRRSRLTAGMKSIC